MKLTSGGTAYAVRMDLRGERKLLILIPGKENVSCGPWVPVGPRTRTLFPVRCERGVKKSGGRRRFALFDKALCAVLLLNFRLCAGTDWRSEIVLFAKWQVLLNSCSIAYLTLSLSHPPHTLRNSRSVRAFAETEQKQKENL